MGHVKAGSNEAKMIKLAKKAKDLPKRPGCYLMKNKDGEVIYVGKAKSLRDRVLSYFNQTSKSPKTEILVSHITQFDFQITETETEAFVLENNLIKKHSPKYNIRLRDDKSYPYVIVDYNEPFPRPEYKRRVERSSKKEIFGPFVQGSNISEVLRILIKSFRLRDCSLREFYSRKEACILYQMNQCSAPCVDKITPQEYEENLKMAVDFFKGKGSKGIKYLEEKMWQTAQEENFEHASMIRDNIEKLKDFIKTSQQKNAELKGRDENIDIISYFEGDIEIDIALYMVRNGILLGHKNFHFPVVDCEESITDELISYLYQYYTETHDSLPDSIILPFDKEQFHLLQEGLKITSDKEIKVKSPGKKYASLMKLTKEQAFEYQRVRISNQESVFVGLNRLKELLNLRERPIVLECYDVAIWQGSSPTASQIVFENGKPNKKDYRHYHLQEVPEGNNDFAMMRELIERRIEHGKLPDVFVVDGGIGQVNIFAEVLREKEILRPVVGIAKSKTKKTNVKNKNVEKTEERLIIPGRVNPYILKKNPPLFRILVQMRDEAHRFSRKLHHHSERQKLFGSWIDLVSGIGPKTKQRILSQLNLSIEELKELDVNQIAQELKVNAKLSKKIKDVLDDL